MKRRSTGLALAALALLGPMVALQVGCADINDTAMLALSTKVTAYAIVNDQLVQGDMVLYPDRSGTISLRSDVPSSWWSHITQDANPFAAQPQQPAPAPAAPPPGQSALSSCFGRMHYTASNLGSIDLRCNDGANSDVRVALIGETRGYGYGQTAKGLSSLTFGMSPTEARAHLTVPSGKQLQERTDTTGLELK